MPDVYLTTALTSRSNVTVLRDAVHQWIVNNATLGHTHPDMVFMVGVRTTLNPFAD